MTHLLILTGGRNRGGQWKPTLLATLEDDDAEAEQLAANGEHAMIGKIICGGQTGVDQAALRAAKACGIPTGGWAPNGWRTEDGPAPWLADFGMQEHASADYPDRTRANVGDAGLTLILITRESDLVRGTALTLRDAQARKAQGIDHYVSVMSYPGAAERCRDALTWFASAGDCVVNVAGPRESESPGIGERAEKFLTEVFQPPG
jgi:hypothetical protein